MTTVKYCIWHRRLRKVAVNLTGQRLENLSEGEAEALLELSHPYVRDTVEVRAMPKGN